ncbi:hypothetical protein EV191_12350 [Tamaricihabitans halophyticus]|uniref:DUF8129 domain-containing protein n=1 Tax=Tamaricihabitans halophyticus TaxID=1262583 RepID=A0A4R2Q2A0_9PSEU|nr:hypothetical protein [Tamaricihabitans halophyticus]TCP42650.1 hypothetical protein EV191_12350 [Tamaricihabitans halophyticus]
MTEQPELPLRNYDELPITSLRHQIRSLDDAELRVLVAHERAHAARAPVLELLESRLARLREGAHPAQGDQAERSERPESTSHGSAASAQSAAKPRGPLRHGVISHTPPRDRP